MAGLISPVSTRTAEAEDTLVLKNGRKAACVVTGFTADAVKITWHPAPGSAAEQRTVPLAEVDYVDLAPLPGEREALAEAVRDGRSEPLMIFWAKRLPWLGYPRTNGGEIGLTYAELLTRVATPDRMERALKIYEQIEKGDWSDGRRGRARAGRLRVMLRQGRTGEVRPQAEALLAAGGDARVLIELHHVLGEAAAASLAELEETHPRWEQEEDIVPQHALLLESAFDGYLFAHLFHGAEEDLAARGLWAAARLSIGQRNPVQAAEWAEDLRNLYPGTPEASTAADWLEKQLPLIRPAAPASSNSGTERKTSAATGSRRRSAGEDNDAEEEDMEEEDMEEEEPEPDEGSGLSEEDTGDAGAAVEQAAGGKRTGTPKSGKRQKARKPSAASRRKPSAGTDGAPDGRKKTVSDEGEEEPDEE